MADRILYSWPPSYYLLDISDVFVVLDFLRLPYLDQNETGVENPELMPGGESQCLCLGHEGAPGSSLPSTSGGIAPNLQI